MWIERLTATGPDRDAALVDLHALLLRAARFEVGRRRATSPQLRGDYDDLAHQSADDALVAILGKLGEFRGDSRFTTWAYKFALYEAAAKVRKRAWQGREIPLEAETWPLIPDDRQRTAQQSVGPQTDSARCMKRSSTTRARTNARCSSRSRSTRCRSTCLPSGSTRAAGPSTRLCTTEEGSSGPRSQPAT